MVDKPRKSNPEMKVLGTHEVDLLLNRIKKLSLYMPVFLAVTTSMLGGKLCGLKWENVDLDEGVIYVKNQLQTIDDIK